MKRRQSSGAAAEGLLVISISFTNLRRYMRGKMFVVHRLIGVHLPFRHFYTGDIIN